MGVLMKNLSAFSTRDLQNCLAIIASVAESDVNSLRLTVLAEVSSRAAVLIDAQSVPKRSPKKRHSCPSCKKGYLVLRSIDGYDCYFCVDRSTNKSGCGWSQMVEK